MVEAMTPSGQAVALNWLSPEAGAALLRDSQGGAWLADGLQAADCGLDPGEVIARAEGGNYRVILVKIAGQAAALVVVEIGYAGEPPKKTLSVVSAGGSQMYQWLGTMQRALREIASGQGCERVMVCGRPGWERALRAFGWHKVGVIMSASPIAFINQIH